MKIEAVPVKVNREVYDKVKSYSQCTGIPAARVITEALTDWLETVGETRLEALTQSSACLSSKVVSINKMN